MTRSDMNCEPWHFVKLLYAKPILQACRGSNASKGAVRKVSKQVALAFVKRTLDRCQKFEETGNSCFTDPVLRDVMFSAPSCNSDIKSIDCIGSGTASNTCNEVSHQAEVRGSGNFQVKSVNDFHKIQ